MDYTSLMIKHDHLQRSSTGFCCRWDFLVVHSPKKDFFCFIFLLIVAKNGERILGPTISFCLIIDMCVIIWIWMMTTGSCLLHMKFVPWWWQTFKYNMLDLSKVDCQLIVDLYGHENSKRNSKNYLKPRFFNDFGEGCLLQRIVEDRDHPVERQQSSKV